METDENYISLENIDWDKWEQRLNSPRSIEACKKCGVDPNDLYYVNYETYLSLNQELKTKPKDFQELRYNHFEKMRRENLKLCREERLKLIKTENFKRYEDNQLSKSFNQSKSIEMSNFYLTGVSNEQRTIEQMKKKQKMEIEFLLDSETKVEKIRKENEEKEFNEKIRQEQIKKNLFDKQKREEELKLKKEKYRQDLLKIEIDEQQQRNLMRFIENQTFKGSKSLDPNSLFEEDKMIESFRKHNSKTLEQAMIHESNLHEMQKKTIERQRMMMERDKIRVEGRQQKLMENKLESLKFKEYTERKIAFAKSQFNVKIMQQKNELERKDKLNEEKRKYFDQLKSMASKREKEFHRIKTMDMMKSLERYKFIEKEKMLNFIEKHKKLEEQKYLLDLANEQRSQSKELNLNNNIDQAKIKVERQLMLRAMNVKKKHELLEKRAIKLKENIEREKMYKNEMNLLKKEELKYNLLKQRKIDQYNKDKNIEKMKAKDQRIMEFKKQKDGLEKEKRNAQDFIHRKKSMDKEFYEKVMKHSSKISLDELQEYFPGDEKIIEKFIKFKDEQRDYSLNSSKSQINRSYDNYLTKRKNTEINLKNSLDYTKNLSLNNSFDKIY